MALDFTARLVGIGDPCALCTVTYFPYAPITVVCQRDERQISVAASASIDHRQCNLYNPIESLPIRRAESA
jgi:hypothetical protein